MRVFLAAVLLAAFAFPAQAQSLAAKLEASRLASRVEIALAQDEALRAFTFRSAVRDGVLTLTGRVETAAQRDRASSLAQSIEGITSVVNSVIVGGGGAAALGMPTLPPVDTVPEPPAQADSVAADTTPPEAAPPEAMPEPEPAPEPEKVYHTVRRGDTLGAIAKRYGVSVRQVQQLNGLRSSTIRAGQRLRVK